MEGVEEEVVEEKEAVEETLKEAAVVEEKEETTRGTASDINCWANAIAITEENATFVMKKYYPKSEFLFVASVRIAQCAGGEPHLSYSMCSCLYIYILVRCRSSWGEPERECADIARRKACICGRSRCAHRQRVYARPRVWV